MRRIAAITLATVMLLIGGGALPAFADGQEPISITSRAELEAIATAPGGQYRLDADIDLGDAAWRPFDFSGTLDGAGHTLYNVRISETNGMAITVDGNQIRYDTTFAALFSCVRGAAISDLHLVNLSATVQSDTNCFAAGIAGYMEDAVISGCSVTGRIRLDADADILGVGGIAGFGYGSIIDCTTDVTLVVANIDNGRVCEQFLGGIFACGYVTIKNATVQIDGYASVHGYAHSGGVSGMHYIYNNVYDERIYIRGCTVNGAITFFEESPSRRAYCKAVCGEPLGRGIYISGCIAPKFTKNEIREYDRILLPHTCENPQYSQALTKPTCTECGYTTYTCTACGYQYTDEYTLPAHQYQTVTSVPPTCTEPGYTHSRCTSCGATSEETLPATGHQPGEWIVETPPSYTADGQQAKYCTNCGIRLEASAVPMLTGADSIAVTPSALTLKSRAVAKLTVATEPAGAIDAGVSWHSSNTMSVLVDQNGVITAAHPGTATITASDAWGNRTAECQVTVRYTVWQWLIVLFLFGFLWY